MTNLFCLDDNLKKQFEGAKELEETSFVKEVTPLHISSYKLLWSRPNWHCIDISFSLFIQHFKFLWVVLWFPKAQSSFYSLSGNTFWKLAKIISTTACTQCTLLLRRFFWNTWTSQRQIALQNSEWRKIFGCKSKWCHCVVWGLLPWLFRAGLWDICFNLELMHTISLSLSLCDSRLFCTAVMMRDKLVKASFPASLGKALEVRTHHRSRCQHLLCCKLKLETFKLNICVFGDRPAVISVKKWKKLQQQSAWDQFPHLQGVFFNCSAQISVLKRKTLFNQLGSFVHHGTESLIGCPLFSFCFWYWKLGGTVEKNTLYKYPR